MTKKMKDKKFEKIEKIINRRLFLKNSASLIGLVNEYFWKSLTGPFFAFVFPLMFITLLGYLLSYNIVLGGCLSIGGIVISVYCLPNSIFDFKKSSLLKRIGVTPINPTNFILTVCGYYCLMMIISLFWCILISLLLFAGYWTKGPWVHLINNSDIELTNMPSLLTVLANVEWGGFIFSQLLVIMTGTSLGMLIVAISKTVLTIQAMSVTLLIIAMILGGQLVPVSIVRSVEPLWYLGYAIDPFKSSMDMAMEAWNGPINNDAQHFYGHSIMNCNNSTIWNVHQSYVVFSTMVVPGSEGIGKVNILSMPEKILNFIIPFIWSALFLFISSKKFKWSSR